MEVLAGTLTHTSYRHMGVFFQVDVPSTVLGMRAKNRTQYLVEPGRILNHRKVRVVPQWHRFLLTIKNTAHNIDYCSDILFI